MYKPIIWGIAIMALSVGASPAPAGWSENIRLTYRGNEINPQVIARNDTIHIVWEQIGAGDVSYIRSTDGGQTWGPIIDLTASDHYGYDATLNLAENGLLVAWFDNDYALTSIGISKSVDGSVWEDPSYVWTENPNRFAWPTSAVKSDSIFLIYFSERDDSTGRRPFRAMHSYDSGRTWSDEVTVGYPLVLAPQPIRMRYCHGVLLAAWTCLADSNHLGQYHIIGKRSIDAGRSWSDTIWISPDIPYWAQSVCLACNNTTGQFAAGWTDFRYQIYAFHGDIFASISDDGGASWPFETQASVNPTAWWPGLDFAADTMVAVWSDMQFYLERWHEIVLNRSNDGGLTWQGEERLTYTEDESYQPWVSLDNGKISVAWEEAVPGTAYEIFYKKYTPDSTVRIEEPEAPPLPELWLSAYPNPFNSDLTIIVRSEMPGVLNIYDIQGRTIRQYSYEKGSQKIIWDGRTKDNQPLTSGTYFIGRKGGKMEEIIRVEYLK